MVAAEASEGVVRDGGRDRPPGKLLVLAAEVLPGVRQVEAPGDVDRDLVDVRAAVEELRVDVAAAAVVLAVAELPAHELRAVLVETRPADAVGADGGDLTVDVEGDRAGLHVLVGEVVLR